MNHVTIGIPPRIRARITLSKWVRSGHVPDSPGLKTVGQKWGSATATEDRRAREGRSTGARMVRERAG